LFNSVLLWKTMVWSIDTRQNKADSNLELIEVTCFFEATSFPSCLTSFCPPFSLQGAERFTFTTCSNTMKSLSYQLLPLSRRRLHTKNEIVYDIIHCRKKWLLYILPQLLSGNVTQLTRHKERQFLTIFVSVLRTFVA